MGYHDATEIPNYWAYAQQFVLQDHMFPSVGSWSQPVHLFMVSAWSALCSKQDDPSSCTNEPKSPDAPPDFQTLRNWGTCCRASTSRSPLARLSYCRSTRHQVRPRSGLDSGLKRQMKNRACRQCGSAIQILCMATPRGVGVSRRKRPSLRAP